MNVSAAVNLVSPNSSSASSGRTVRSWPIMPPTRALTPTSSENWARFSRSPSGPASVGGRGRCAHRPTASGWPLQCRPGVGAAVEHRHVAVAAGGEDAGAGHRPFAVPAHHRHRPVGDGAVGEAAELDVDRPGDVAGLELAALADVDHGADDLVRVDERDPGDLAAGRSPGVDAAVELADDVLVADVEALADDLVAVLVVAGDDHDRPVEVDEPAEPAGEHRSQRRSRSNRARARRRTRRSVGRSTIRAPAATCGRRCRRRAGRVGELRVVAWSAPVELGQPGEVGRERTEPGQQLLDEGVLVVDAEQVVGGPLRPSVVVRSAPPGAEQNEPAPWVG